MRKSLVGLVCLCFACADPRPIQRIETATPAGGGRFWAAGNGGLGLYYDGQRWMHRDYPLNPEVDRDLYDPLIPIPVATVALTGGESILFTRVGDVLRWTGAAWERLSVSWPKEGSSNAQIDRVFVEKDDSIWVQIHSQTLVHGTLADFRAGRFQKQQTPTYFIQLELVDGHFFALGWASDGETMIGFEQRGASWQPLGRIGREAIGRDRGLFVLSSGQPVGVVAAGLIPLTRDAPLGNLDSFLEVHPFDPEHTPYTAGGPFVARVFSADRGKALMVSAVSDGSSPDVVELRGERAFAWRCNPSVSSDVAAAFPLEGGWRIVESGLDFADLPSARCKPAKAAAVIAK